MSLPTTADEGDQVDTGRIADALDRRLDVPTLTFPEDWGLSGAWKRAFSASAHVGSVSPAEFMVMLTRPDAPPDLSSLSDAQREVYVAVSHGATPADVARRTGREPSTARTHLNRARDKLANQPPVWGDPHRVLFTLYDDDLAAECDCDGYRYRQWCAHISLLWWRWVRGRLVVTDLNADENHQFPPRWLSVNDESTTGQTADSRPTDARADGGERQ